MEYTMDSTCTTAEYDSYSKPRMRLFRLYLKTTNVAIRKIAYFLTRLRASSVLAWSYLMTRADRA
jgi:hypothetical protein